ncbi:MAG: UDP-N-acetylmuramoyl-L-alanine--D-glutamate ligase [Parvibaculum sp.]
MIAARAYKGRKVAVFGLGGSGLSTARALVAGGADVMAWDDSTTQCQLARDAGVPVVDLREVSLDGCAVLVLAPGVPLTHPEPHDIVKKAAAAGVPVLGDVELFQHEVRTIMPDAQIVAITGTNGKSTTTALVAHMVNAIGRRAEMGGNIGKPVFDLEPPRRDTIYVIEVSSYQIDLAPTLRPNIGVLLNVTPDHIDRHGTLENYAGIKGRLFRHQSKDDTAIVGVDDQLSADICTSICGRRETKLVPVSVQKTLGRGSYVIDGVLYDSRSGKTDRVGDLRELKRLAGAHNWQNAAAAYSVGRTLGFAPEKILASFRTFPGLAHRMEIVAEAANILFVNDSKATNAEAAAKALDAYQDVFWIAGGVPKAGGIASLEPWFGNIAQAYLIGEAADAFAATLDGHVPASKAGTLDAAIAEATAHAMMATKEGRHPVVLLSPACASFDQFKNFEARGDAFRTMVQAAVRSLPRGGAAA